MSKRESYSTSKRSQKKLKREEGSDDDTDEETGFVSRANGDSKPVSAIAYNLPQAMPYPPQQYAMPHPFMHLPQNFMAISAAMSHMSQMGAYQNSMGSVSNGICYVCKRPITSEIDAIMMSGIWYHQNCLVGFSRPTNMAPYMPSPYGTMSPNIMPPSSPSMPVPHKMAPSPVAPAPLESKIADPVTTSDFGGIQTHPAEFQIAAYNIHPIPTVVLPDPVDRDRTITAQLIETSSRIIITKGFKAGAIQVFRAGTRLVTFTSLKLNKMGYIKQELQEVNLRPRDCTFAVRFVMDQYVWETTAFHIVSSYSQLTPDEQVKRPFTKKPGKGQDEAPGPVSSPVGNSSPPNASVATPVVATAVPASSELPKIPMGTLPSPTAETAAGDLGPISLPPINTVESSSN